MKIALYLTDNKRRHDGVTTFLHEMLKAFLSGENAAKAELLGGALLSRKENKEEISAAFQQIVPGVKVNLVKTAYPAVVLSRAEYLFKRNYDKIFGEKADVYIFPVNFVPKNKPQGCNRRGHTRFNPPAPRRFARLDEAFLQKNVCNRGEKRRRDFHRFRIFRKRNFKTLPAGKG